jgi:hypothetical protein
MPLILPFFTLFLPTLSCHFTSPEQIFPPHPTHLHEVLLWDLMAIKIQKIERREEYEKKEREGDKEENEEEGKG